MLNNILDNAQDHGYSDGAKMQVIASFEIFNDQLQIVIENNGKPFPKGYTKSAFVKKFNSSKKTEGTGGIGGYDVDRIIKDMSGTWDLELDSSIEMPVKFIISLPIKTDSNV